MNRRDFMSCAVTGVAATQVSDLFPPRSLGAEAESTPQWLTDQPLIIVGNWDSMPIFQVRRGGESTALETEYQAESSESTVKKLKALGVTLATLHFYKGFGLKAEQPHIEIAKKLAALLHQNDIRVGLYVGSTIAYETFLLEKPEAEEWFVPDFLGQPVTYHDQPFRKRVYFMHPGYLEYMKAVVRMGVEDLKADEIHLDNTSLQAEPVIFHHPLAVKDFREYLTANYTPAELTERLGFSNLTYVVPPKFDAPLVTIDDPLLQEWAGFRCHQLNRYYAAIKAVIKGANPNTAIATNPHSGISGRNTIWEQGVHYPAFLPQLDITWTEEGDYARMTPEGVLVSKIRTYKMASHLKKRVMTYTAGSDGGGKLAMGECMAYNRQTLGMVGDVLDAAKIPEDQKRYIDFFRRHFDHYRGVENIADVAVLYSYATMGFNNNRPAVSFMLFTQALIQAKIPFDIIFDEDLRDLRKYRAVVLADQECLDDSQMDLIRLYVRQGGGLVATEQTSLYTLWRLRRREFGLRDLFGVEPSHWARREAEKDLEITPVRNRAGQGRVVYLAAVKPAIEKSPAVSMSFQYWKLPLNWQEIIEAVRCAVGGKFSLEVEAPTTLAVTAEIMQQPAKNRRLVHLLNYAAPEGLTVSGVRVEVELPESKHARQVTLLSPDGSEPIAIPIQTSQNRARFTVPSLKTYTLAVLDLE